MNPLLRATLFFLCAIHLCANAQDDRVVVSKPDVKFREWERPSRDISGSDLIVVGIHSGNVNARLYGDVVTIHARHPLDQNICIFVEHVSGGYYAIAEVVNVPDTPTFGVHLPIGETLHRFGNPHWDEMALTAILKTSKTCEGQIPTAISDYVLPTWDGETPRKVRMLLNPPNAGDVDLYIGDQDGRCRRLKTSTTLSTDRAIQAYWMVCDIELPVKCSRRERFDVIVYDSAGSRSPGVAGNIIRNCDSPNEMPRREK